MHICILTVLPFPIDNVDRLRNHGTIQDFQSLWWPEEVVLEGSDMGGGGVVVT